MEFNEFFREQNASTQNGGMRFIESFYDGMRVADIYLVKTKNAALTKNGKEYLNVTLQDRTGQVDAKVWEPNTPGIAEYHELANHKDPAKSVPQPASQYDHPRE